MARVTVELSKILGKMKPMQAVNNGPVGVIIPSQNRNNFEEYKAARIPYARNHDASEWIDYGGEFAVDVYNIFPDFDADPEDEANYEFDVTDALVKFTQDTGTEVYYRLGSRIEHQCKKYRTVKPRDFKKWAVVCEHIIKHYNEGWANGFHYGIKHFEIWNEPDLDVLDVPSDKRRTWSGTPSEFYEFYAVVAAHLKEKFPHLKIGGPAIAHRTGEWLDGFLERLTKDGKRVPMDFFSWHWYGTEPKDMLKRANVVREKLDRAGYGDAESHLNEWNYVADWCDGWLDTVRDIISMKGAAFISACMSEGQNSPAVDMMMYYEVAPTTMNGVFDFYTCKPIKGYWALYAFSDLCDLGTHVEAKSDDGDIYVTAALSENGESGVLVTYYTARQDAKQKTVTVSLCGADARKNDIYTVDENHSYEITDTQEGNTVTLTMQPNSFVFLKSGR